MKRINPKGLNSAMLQMNYLPDMVKLLKDINKMHLPIVTREKLQEFEERTIYILKKIGHADENGHNIYN